MCMHMSCTCVSVVAYFTVIAARKDVKPFKRHYSTPVKYCTFVFYYKVNAQPRLPQSKAAEARPRTTRHARCITHADHVYT